MAMKYKARKLPNNADLNLYAYLRKKGFTSQQADTHIKMFKKHGRK